MNIGIAANYEHDFSTGLLHQKHFKNSPFPHAVMPNFFEPQVYERIRQAAFQTWAVDTDYSNVGRYGVVTHPEILHRFYGREFREFLKELTGFHVERAENCFPQLRIVNREKHGLSIHNDDGLHYNVGLIYHMTRDWDETVGGRLNLWEKTPDGLFRLHSMHPPKENTLVLLVLGATSYHSVEPLKREHQRVTLIQEWKTCPLRQAL